MKLNRDQKRELWTEIADVINAWADDWGIAVSEDEMTYLAQAIVDSDPVLFLLRAHAQAE